MGKRRTYSHYLIIQKWAYPAFCIASLFFADIEFEARSTIAGAASLDFSPSMLPIESLCKLHEILGYRGIGLLQSLHQIWGKLVLLLADEGVGCPLVASATYNQ